MCLKGLGLRLNHLIIMICLLVRLFVIYVLLGPT